MIRKLDFLVARNAGSVRAMKLPAALLAMLFVIACGTQGSAPPASDGPTTRSDPFAAQPDTSEGLVNVSADLEAVLEHGALAAACAESAAAPADRKKRLLCGKAMFFYESFGTPGVPKPIITWLVNNFPDDVGPGFSKLGMVPDPHSSEKLPLGLPLGPKLGSVDTLSFGCASCHFGRLADGRYAIGAANLAYDYGRMNLMMTVLPALAIPGANEADHDPDALAMLAPLRTRMAMNSSIKTALITALLPLIAGGSGMLPAFDKANEHWYSRWRTGTMDFFIQPLPFDDQVHTISKISSLWAIPDETERTAHGIDSAMLGWTGGTASLHNFLVGFVDLGGGKIADWPDARVGPLADYVYSLRAPTPTLMPAAEQVTQGGTIFAAACLECHGGPRGMGSTLYAFETIGTDAAIKWWADGPDHDGQPCCGLRFTVPDRITNRIKSPRLSGLWAMDRFLHNGALDSLEQLLCLAPRPGVNETAFGDGGHTFGCELPEADRVALAAYLRAH